MRVMIAPAVAYTLVSESPNSATPTRLLPAGTDPYNAYIDANIILLLTEILHVYSLSLKLPSMADKEACVFIVDLGKSMNERHGGRQETDLEWCMKYVWDKITTQVSNNAKECVRVVELKSFR